MKLALFDIDDTLLRNSMAHKEAFLRAFENVYGAKNVSLEFKDYYGLTDKQIIIKVLENHGLDQALIIERIDACMKEMINLFPGLLKNRADLVLIHGVKPTLEKLKEKNVLMGLVTGNLEQIAWLKLRNTGIAKYFRFGGFGNDSTERSELVKLAIQRAEKHGFKLDKDNINVYHFGDTPLDIKAGMRTGAITIGVATGPYSTGVLKQAGADHVINGLQDTDRVLRILKIVGS